VRLSRTVAPLDDSCDTARKAAGRARKSPKTAEPLPDMAAAMAPASRSDALIVAISGCRRTTGGSRSLTICAARVGHGTGRICSSGRGSRAPAARSSSYQPYASAVDTPNSGRTITTQCRGRSTSG
jgi:hypothetical protein